jgi:hypothetical protein
VARVLSSIAVTAPTGPVSAGVNDAFDFVGTPTLSGGGGVQRYDFRWEVDDGGGFVPIAASGTGLNTAGTNPLVNTNSQTANTLNVVCTTPGSYTIRMVGAPTSGGSYTVVSATQTVEVSAGAEEHSGTLVVSGGGSVAASASKRASEILPVSGGGTMLLVAETARRLVLSVSGGGSFTVAAEADIGAEEHFATLSVSGGGSVALTSVTGRLTAFAASGGGAGAVAVSTERLSVLSVAAGGSVDASAVTARAVTLQVSGGGGASVVYDATWQEGGRGSEEEHSGTLSVSGGGAAMIASETERAATLLVAAGGSAAIVHSTHRSVHLSVAGGGGVLIIGVPPPSRGPLYFYDHRGVRTVVLEPDQ